MQLGISSAEVRLVAEFLSQYNLSNDDPKYEEGYRQAIEDMKELLSEKIRQNVERVWEEMEKAYV
ncbi:hypothetical protein IR123_09975 [Streptococcus sp. 19428wC2_LYSM12]|uniref:hypothetical protein n=1 Tax=unclassified Streptococcus TaxID=2608887 RepID=UPI001072D5F4|nr:MULTISPECIES: hypothetical protein [unclassified Streptococcus]MBF0788202.1 hypothetical protein [Streptococcus sp. 19428wC2_LYSM12]TFV04714.1 hypothetical protein E4T79_09960 [Streptococcus sp. LYSM12]